MMLNIYAIALLLLASGPEKVADPSLGSLLTAHNRERVSKKLEPLRLSTKLCESARIHATDMARHQRRDHKGSDGSTVAERVKRENYVFVAVGENIADGQKTVGEVVKSWMNSSGHRANILGDFSEMGAAHVEDKEGVIYWCVNFAKPMPRLKPDEAAAGVLEALNKLRETAKRPKLRAQPALGRAASSLCARMAAKDSLKIDGDPFKIVDDQGVINRELRLLMSANAPTAAEATKSLLADDAGELDAFDEIGIGYAIADSGTPYWCAIFAKPAPPRRIIRP